MPFVLTVLIIAFILCNVVILGAQDVLDAKVVSTNGVLEENFNDDNLVQGWGEHDGLDWTLLKLVASSFPGNFVLSPVGLKLILSFLREASIGETATELIAIFGEDTNRTENRIHFSNITQLLQKTPPENVAHLSSWIFIPTDFEKRKRFAAIAETFYNIEIKTVDTQSPEKTVKEINSTVLNATLGNILNSVNKEDVIDMRMLVLNTVYFEGRWRYQFPLSATRADDFYVSPTSPKIVPLMNIINMFYYAESTKFDAKILRIPYENRRLAMYFIVPNSLTGLSYIVENIKLVPYELQFLRKENVHVTMPKFKLAYTSSLEKTLKEMDLLTAFEDSAMFLGIAQSKQGSKRLKLSKVKQRSLIEVKEMGSGVSSTAGIPMANELNKDMNEVKEVVANRPFFFFIQDDATRQLLAFGRVIDPTLTEGSSIDRDNG